MKQFIRNFRKQKTVGILNICSLGLGIMVAIIVGLWAINELSFDNFHKNKDRMYRYVVHRIHNNAPAKFGSMAKEPGEQAKDEYPAVEDVCRVIHAGADIYANHAFFKQVPAFIADANFFTFFTFKLKQGNPADVLSAPGNVVISETTAVRFFPGQDPVGQTIRYEGQEFAVSGVMEDMPINSSLQAGIVFPPAGIFLKDETDEYVTFFLLRKNTDIQALTGQMQQAYYKADPLRKERNEKLELEPLTDMHFSRGFFVDHIRKGNQPLVMVFVVTALVILVISCINFVNLFISTSFIRAGTIGIKKTQGAGKAMLLREFYFETACYVLISIAIGLYLAQLILPAFNNFTQSRLVIDYLSAHLYLFIALLFVVTVLLAGTFPAVYMTRLDITEALKGKYKGKQVSLLQKGLIVVQFAASIALLLVVGFMQKQVNFIMSRNLGFDKENVLYVQGYEEFTKNYDAFRGELLKNPSIKDITMKGSLPTEWNGGGPVKKLGSDDAPFTVEFCPVKPNYFDFFEMKFTLGENPFYLEAIPDDPMLMDVVINERCAEMLGLENPLDQLISMGPAKLAVKGVIRNAQVRSFHQETDPQIYFPIYNDVWNPVFFKVVGDPQLTINIIGQKWKEKEPGYPFEYHFLDETYRQLYASEMNTGKALRFAMLITFMITVSGLFAMAFYSTQRRIKEISLRKINGATVKDLLLLLNKDFVIWVLVAFAIACPVAYFSMQSWLDNFIIRTPLSLWLFALVGLLALLIALATTSYQTWKVANTNPAEVIKGE